MSAKILMHDIIKSNIFLLILQLYFKSSVFVFHAKLLHQVNIFEVSFLNPINKIEILCM